MFRRIGLRDMDLQYDLFDEKKLKDKCPPNVVPGYDGMTINI